MGETQEKERHGYELQSKLWKQCRSKLRFIIPSAMRDCSTYQFRCASLSELEFHNNQRGFTLIEIFYLYSLNNHNNNK